MILEDNEGTVYGLADSAREERFQKIGLTPGQVYDSLEDVEYDLTSHTELRMFLAEVNQLHNDKKLLKEVVRNPILGLKIIDKSQKDVICENLRK